MARWGLWSVRLAATLMLVGSLKAVLDHWQYIELPVDIPQLFLQQVSVDTLRQQVEQAITENRPADARLYLQLAQTFGYPLDPHGYEARLRELESPLNTALRSVTEFGGGFLAGNADTAAGVAGAVVSDFTVVGDVRDLWEQYQIYAAGGTVNELVVTLAGVGAGLTAATVVSAGVASPAKAGVSTAKLAARTGRLTPAFQKFLLRQASGVFDYRAFLQAVRVEKGLDGVRRAAVRAYNPQAAQALQRTATQVGNLRRATSTSDTLHLLQYVDNADELARLEKLGLQYGVQAKGILKLVGKAAIGSFRVLRKTADLFISLAAALASFLAVLATFGRRTSD